MDDYIPLVETLLWMLFFSVFAFLFWKQLRELISAFSRRIEQGGRFKLGSLEIHEISRKQDKQEKELYWIQSIVRLLISDYQRQHLENFTRDKPFLARLEPGASFEWELRHLLNLALLQRKHGKGIRTIFEAGECDLKEHLFITDRGREYLLLLKDGRVSDDDSQKRS